jgi:DNA-binding NtrC family response regulator
MILHEHPAHSFVSIEHEAHDGPESWLDQAARRTTGHLGVKEAQRRLRFEMFRQAFETAGGNRHEVARILRVDRRYVLKLIAEGIAMRG